MVHVDYAEAVKKTFETRPLRTVLMIDDQFPTYANLLEEAGGVGFKEKDRALVVYRGFKARHMVCDVENKVGGTPADVIRKSDLVVLDYNLGPTDDDNERAITILRELATTKHFNTIVVYTAEPDQDRVWLEIAASLAGGWDMPAFGDDAQQQWDRLSGEGQLPAPSREAQRAVVAADFRSLPADEKTVMRDDLVAAGVPVGMTTEFIRAGVIRALREAAGKHADEPKQLVRGRCKEDGPRWVQCRNCFVAILKKGALEPENADDPAGIMACLGRALLDWQPNLFQIVISEMQNILELEALVTEDEHLRDAVTQTALWYYLLDSLGDVDLAAEDLAEPILSNVVDKIVDGLRRRLSTDPELLAMAGRALKAELEPKHLKSRPARGSAALFDVAHDMARPPQAAARADVMFRLNSFLCTEPFRRTHLTTGTIFKAAGSEDYWVAASPACDMVARKPGAFQRWTRQLHPTMALVAFRLVTENMEVALKNAELGQFVFLELGNQKQAFRVLNERSGQPAYELMFPQNEGAVTLGGDGLEFKGTRLLAGAEEPERVLTPGRFLVVGQLRPTNANRLLQLAGQHLSRIGMDFLNMTET